MTEEYKHSDHTIDEELEAHAENDSRREASGLLSYETQHTLLAELLGVPENEITDIHPESIPAEGGVRETIRATIRGHKVEVTQERDDKGLDYEGRIDNETIIKKELSDDGQYGYDETLMDLWEKLGGDTRFH